MAEQFLNKLNEIETKVQALGETLKRMITILGAITEIKSEVRIAKEEILEQLKTMSSPEESLSAELAQLVVTEVRAAKDEILSAPAMTSAKAPAGEGTASADTERLAEMIKTEIGFLGKFLGEQLEAFKQELLETVKSIEVPAPAPAAAAPVAAAQAATAPAQPSVAAPAAAAPAAQEAPPPAAAPATAPSRVSLEQGLKIVEQLERIIASMKMGCIAGDVLATMNDAKAEIMKVTPSDPIMVKIDRWASVVSSYQKRHQLQARDILKLKKEIRAEIPKYKPA